MVDAVSTNTGWGKDVYNKEASATFRTSSSSAKSKIPRYQPTNKSVVVSPLQSPNPPGLQHQNSYYGHQPTKKLYPWQQGEIQQNSSEDSEEQNVAQFTQSSSNLCSPTANPSHRLITPTSTIQRSRPADRDEEGMANKSCLKIRLASSTSHNKNSMTTNSTKSTVQQGQKTSRKSRFGWISNRRGTSNSSSHSSQNHASTGGSTSQTSRSSQQQNLSPDDEIEDEGYDPDYPTGSSWAEGSLSPPPLSIVKDLFSPPPVQDRGSDRRRIQQYEKQKRSKQKVRSRTGGLYEGEIEPQGVRGQEAKVPSNSRIRNKGNPSPSPARYETTPLPISNTTLRVISPVPKSPFSASNMKNSLLSPSDEDGSDHEFQLNDSENDADMFWNQEAQHRAALHVAKPSSAYDNQTLKPPLAVASSSTRDHSALRSTPIFESGKARSRIPDSRHKNSRNCDVSESTCSDDNVEGMMSDFVSTSTAPTHNILHSPSALGLGSLQRQYSNSFDSDVEENVFRDDANSNSKISTAENNNRGRKRDVRVSSQSNSCSTRLMPHRDNSNQKSDRTFMKSYDLSGRDAKISYPHKNGPMIDKQSSTGTSTTTESSSDSPSQIDALNALAVEHVNACQYDDALQLFTCVLHLHQEMHGVNTPHPDTASSFHNLGTVHAKRAQAFENVNLALSSSASKNNENSRLIKHHDEQQKQARALSLHCFQAAARSARDSLGKNHPNVAVSLVRIGFLLLQAKQYQNARTTFQEALRIRMEFYGTEHSLVANLYNNLGVCNMHLGEFQRGFTELEKALHLQRKIIRVYETANGKQPGALANSDPAMTAHMLELSDTLFNIGGLCLEWVRKNGDGNINLPFKNNFNERECKIDCKARSVQACCAFEEAYEIRLAAYDQNKNHPAVVQIRSLLEVARRYRQQDRPSDASSLNPRSGLLSLVATTANSPPRQENENIFLKLQSPSHARSFQPSISSRGQNQGTQTPPTDNDTTDNISSREKLRTLSKSPILKRYQKEVGEVVVADDDTTDNISSREKLRTLSKSPILKRYQKEVGEVVVADDSRDISSVNVDDIHAIGSRDSSIFRDTDKTSPQVTSNQTSSRKSQPSASRVKADNRPPIEEISISLDETDVGPVHLNENKIEDKTRIFISPHIVPKTSPVRLQRVKENPGCVSNNSCDVAYNSFSLERDSFLPDVSTERSLLDDDQVDEKLQYRQPLLHAFTVNSSSYDAEENCLIRNTGVDSVHGRIHYPIDGTNFSSQNSPNALNTDSWIGNDEHGFGASGKMDIMVTQPFRDMQTTTRGQNQNARPIANEFRPQRHDKSSASTGSQFGCEAVSFSTGNKERDEIMARARALLETTCSDSDDEDSSSVEENEPRNVDDGNTGTSSNSLVQDVLEDGIAPLGDWNIPLNPNRRQRDIKELLRDPMPVLPEIHEQASKQLKNNNVTDAIHLFEVILRCQRRRHGALHPDVAAALHNIGIAQLRVHNHNEALNAFEEAARIRKGCLGKDHPLVAVSLVKVGITLLLLHRFEEALWSFREALSVRKNSLGPLHPSTARIYNNIGCVYVEFNEFREARRAFEAALDTQRNALSNDPTSGPLMFGTATTLCNLGYLYRFRDMHEKAATVLKEAAALQEAVLGKNHATVLSTLDNLADSCSNSGNGNEALKYYNVVLERFRANSHGERNCRVLRAEAVLHYKMSRVHRLRNDRENQLSSLELALTAVRSCTNIATDSGVQPTTVTVGEKSNTPLAAIPTSSDALERRILSDIQSCRHVLEKEQQMWI